MPQADRRAGGVKRPGAHRAGFVALLGEPNAGKSTLLNRLVGAKVAIVSPKPQTTRNRLLGVVTAKDFQIAFLDTPGLHSPRKGPLNQALVEAALSAIGEVDAVALVVDAAKGAAGPEQAAPEIGSALERLRRSQKRSALVLNKSDAVEKPRLLPLLAAWGAAHPFDLLYPVSALTGENADGLLPALAALLPEGPALFPADVLTDQPERVLSAELVREQVFRQTGQEIPYAVAVEVEEFDESRREGKRPLVRILATLHVERRSQKGILIGKAGARLKSIGTAARREIEQLLGCQVFLGLNVRIEEDWTQSDRALRRFGYLGRQGS
ncbi:MAG: GTPase Era [Deltaproteobacteria bacterium]